MRQAASAVTGEATTGQDLLAAGERVVYLERMMNARNGFDARHDDLRRLTHDATSLLVPIMPSSMDIHAATRFISDLLLVAKIDRRERKLAVVANRTRKNTKSFGRLMRFLDSLGIPIIAVLRDSQNFVHAAENGLGLCEMQPSRVKTDLDEIQKIVNWLDGWPERRRDASAVSALGQKPKVRHSMLRRAQFSSA